MQAHYINNRTMEVFRGIDGLAAAVKARSPPLALWRKFVYCDSLTGPLLGSVDHFEVSTEAAAGLSAAVHRTACRAFGGLQGKHWAHDLQHGPPAALAATAAAISPAAPS